MAEGGVGEHRADRARVEGGADVAGHRGGLELKPGDRGQKRDEARDQRQAARARRQREPKPLRRIEPKIRAHAERQHRRHEMDEADKREGGHGRSKSARRGPNAPRAPAFSVSANLCLALPAACGPLTSSCPRSLHIGGSSKARAVAQARIVRSSNRGGQQRVGQRRGALCRLKPERNRGPARNLMVSPEP